MFCGGCGAHPRKCRPSVNNDSRGKNHAQHCKRVWMGPEYCFVEGVELTKASAEHPSKLIPGQKTLLSTANMCGLGEGTVLWRV